MARCNVELLSLAGMFSKRKGLSVIANRGLVLSEVPVDHREPCVCHSELRIQLNSVLVEWNSICVHSLVSLSLAESECSQRFQGGCSSLSKRSVKFLNGA